MTMIKSEEEAREILESLKDTINNAIAKGWLTPAPRGEVKVDHIGDLKYIPHIGLGSVVSRSCYTFAIRARDR